MEEWGRGAVGGGQCVLSGRLGDLVACHGKTLCFVAFDGVSPEKLDCLFCQQ